MVVFSRYSAQLLALFLFLFMFRFPAVASDGFDRGDFRKYVEAEMKKWNVPGAAVLLIRDGKVVFSEGFGYRNVAKKLPVDSETVFPIASCTKTFTPFCLGLLADAGQIDWDEPVRTYYPELMMYDKYVTEHITLRDVLCHRSGLPRHDRVWMYAGLSRDDLMSRLRYLQPNRGFREMFQYNNIVYSIAGIVVEKASGKQWEDFVKERIFEPLGMKRSSLYVDDIKRTDNHALPYALDHERAPGESSGSIAHAVRQIPFQPVNTTGPASCINSSLADMAKWIMLHIDGGCANGMRLISAGTINEILSPQMSIPPTGEFSPFICEATPMISYGLGWVIQPFNGHMMFNHSGGIDGFSSIISFMPREKAGVVVLTNMHTNMLPYIIAFNYYDRLFGKTQVDRGETLRALLNALLKNMRGGDKAKVEGTNSPPSHSLKDYVGIYSNPAYGDVEIMLEGNRLYASYRNVKSPMAHLRYDVFGSIFPFPSGALNLQMIFKMNDMGEIDILSTDLQPGVDEIRFEKRGDSSGAG